MATEHAASGGAARAEGAAVVRRVDTAEFEQHVRNLRGSLALAPGVRRWSTVRADEDGAYLEVRAATAAGDVTASRRIPLPKEAKAALEDAAKDAEADLDDALLDAIARTLAAAALNIGQET